MNRDTKSYLKQYYAHNIERLKNRSKEQYYAHRDTILATNKLARAFFRYEKEGAVE